MPRKRPSVEDIAAKLRQIDVLTAQGKTVAEAVRGTLQSARLRTWMWSAPTAVRSAKWRTFLLTNGDVAAVSVEVGGFLGVGEREVVIMIDQLGLAEHRDDLVSSLTHEQVEQLPEWDD